MSNHVLGRKRRTTPTFVMTFVLGIVVGFTCAYAVFDSLAWDFSKKPVPAAPGPEAKTPPAPSAAPETPASPAPESPTPPETPAPSAIPPASPAPETPGVPPARHLFVSIPGTSLDDATRALLAEYKPGGIVLTPDNLVDEAQSTELVKQIKAATGQGLDAASTPLIALAQEGGPVNPLHIEPAPSPEELGQKNDPALARSTALAYAAAARARGISVVLAPTLDMFTPDVSSPDLRARTFGEKAKSVVSLGLAFADGLLEGGVSPVAKFYPGLAAATMLDGVLTVQKTEMQGLAVLMYPFSEAASHKVPAMLVSHVAVPLLDREDAKRPASISPWLVQKVVRGQWGYEGVLLADDLSAIPLAQPKPLGELAVASLAAGCDAMMLGLISREKLAEVCAAITAASAEGGALGRERLAVSKARLDAWQARIAGLAAKSPEVPAPEVVPAPENLPGAAAPAETAPPNTNIVRHKIGKGETVGGIAHKYGVKAADLKTWNKIEGTEIKAGDELIVHVPDPKATPPEEAKPAPPSVTPEPEAPATTPVPEAKPETPAVTPEPEAPAATPPPEAKPETPAAPPAPEAKPETPAAPPAPEAKPETPAAPPAEATAETAAPATPPPPTAETPAPTPPAEAPKAEDPKPETANAPDAAALDTYTIVKGDNLRRVAERFHTTEAELARINGIADPNLVKLGQQIKVPKH